MRTILPLIFSLIVTDLAAADRGLSRATADWVRLHAYELIGKRHTVQVVGVKPDKLTRDGQWFSAFTFAKDESNGSWIPVLVPRYEVSAFIKRYGTGTPEYVGRNTKNKKLEAIVRVTSDGDAYLDLTPEAAPTGGPPIDATRIRTWTALDGRTMEAEYLSHSPAHVRLRRKSDDRVFELELAKLSEADRAWIAAQ